MMPLRIRLQPCARKAEVRRELVDVALQEADGAGEGAELRRHVPKLRDAHAQLPGRVVQIGKDVALDVLQRREVIIMVVQPRNGYIEA